MTGGIEMRRISATFVLVLALAAPAGSTRADEGGEAAVCAPTFPSYRSSIWYTAGGAWNLSSNLAVMGCSVVRTGLGSPTNLFVDYYDGSTTGAVGCTATAINIGGSGHDWKQSKTSGVASTGGNNFLFTIPSSLIGYVFVRCGIPANVTSASGIVGINLQ
jgi:hypothetical protein